MDVSDKKELLNNLNRLVECNELLAEAHLKAVNVANKTLEEMDQLTNICREIYETLDTKESRSLAEESFFKGLKKILYR